MGELEVRDLTMEFDSGGYRVRPLDRLSLDAEDGELVVLLGPSGCGKTTLLSCLAGLLRPTDGSITFQGIDVGGLGGAELGDYRRRTVGVVFQAFNLLASLSARKNVMVPMTLAGVGRAAAGRRADELLGRVALTERGRTDPGSCPGASSSGWPSPGRWSMIRPWWWPTSPPPTSITSRSRASWCSCANWPPPGRMVVVSTDDDRITHIADRVVELAPQFSGRRQARRGGAPGGRSGPLRTGRPREPRLRGGRGVGRDLPTRSDGTTEVLAEVGSGNYFGEIGPMLNLPRSASARARTGTPCSRP